MKKIQVLNLYAAMVIIGIFVTACSSLSVSEKEEKRNALDEMAATAIAGLVEQDETLQQQIDEALGYAVINMKVTKVPIVGAGGGEGVFVDAITNKHQYFTVSRFDLGLGWGVRSYKALVLIKSQDVRDRLRGGIWEFQAGAEASAGTAASEGAVADEDYTVHILADGGASATATLRVIRMKENSNLVD